MTYITPQQVCDMTGLKYSTVLKWANNGIFPARKIPHGKKAGVIKNLTRKESYKIEKYPPFMQKIFASGGLMASLKKRAKKGK